MPYIEQLIRIIECAKVLERNIEHGVYVVEGGNEKAKEFELFFKNFLYEMLHYDLPLYPTGLNSWLQLLKTPLGKWGYFPSSFLEYEGISLDLVILDDDIGLSEEADELLLEYQSYREVRSQVIQDVLIYCREKSAKLNMQEKYIAFRLFLILHPLTNGDEIELFCLNKNFDPFLTSSLERCYEDLPRDAKYQCQACGWTLQEKTKDLYVCLKSECKHSYDVHSLEEIISELTKRVKESIQLSTVIPGLRELELKKRLEIKKKVKVFLYPELESLGDLAVHIEQNGKHQELFIDVKDYRRPQLLAKKLLEDEEKNLIKTSIVAVPDEKATERYLHYVNQTLLQHGVPSCKIYSFKQIEAMVDQIKEELRGREESSRV